MLPYGPASSIQFLLGFLSLHLYMVHKDNQMVFITSTLIYLAVNLCLHMIHSLEFRSFVYVKFIFVHGSNSGNWMLPSAKHVYWLLLNTVISRIILYNTKLLCTSICKGTASQFIPCTSTISYIIQQYFLFIGHCIAAIVFIGKLLTIIILPEVCLL